MFSRQTNSDRPDSFWDKRWNPKHKDWNEAPVESNRGGFFVHCRRIPTFVPLSDPRLQSRQNGYSTPAVSDPDSNLVMLHLAATWDIFWTNPSRYRNRFAVKFLVPSPIVCEAKVLVHRWLCIFPRCSLPCRALPYRRRFGSDGSVPFVPTRHSESRPSFFHWQCIEKDAAFLGCRR